MKTVALLVIALLGAALLATPARSAPTLYSVKINGGEVINAELLVVDDGQAVPFGIVDTRQMPVACLDTQAGFEATVESVETGTSGSVAIARSSADSLNVTITLASAHEDERRVVSSPCGDITPSRRVATIEQHVLMENDGGTLALDLDRVPVSVTVRVLSP